MNSRDDTDFAQAYERALAEVALPAFAAAGEYARAHGLLCHVGLHRGADGLSELGLHARRPGEGLDCHCLIRAEPQGASLVHENHYGGRSEPERIVGPLASLNRMVLDTRLQAFFQTGFGLSPDYLARRHGGGFW